MPIKRSSNKAAIKQWVDNETDKIYNQVLQAIHNVGLDAVTTARNKENHSWKPQTGNLQSSFGYVIVVNGKIIEGDFRKIGGTTDGSKGMTEAQNFANELASKYPDSIQLIVVAGMPYAQYLEARGYNVLDMSEVNARRDFAKKYQDVVRQWNQG